MNEMFPPQRKTLFLSNVLQREPSCSLVKFCSTDSPTDPAQSSCQAQSTHAGRPWSTKPCLPKHEVKKDPPPPSHTHTLPTPNKWHDIAPDKADKVTWPATSDGQWSRVVTTPRRGDGLTEVNLHSIYFPPASGKTNYTTIDDNKFTQWINSRAMFVMY